MMIFLEPPCKLTTFSFRKVHFPDISHQREKDRGGPFDLLLQIVLEACVLHMYMCVIYYSLNISLEILSTLYLMLNLNPSPSYVGNFPFLESLL